MTSRSIAPYCDNCAKPLDDPGPRVKVKRFCSNECRNRFHARLRQQAFERFRQEVRELAATIINKEKKP